MAGSASSATSASGHVSATASALQAIANPLSIVTASLSPFPFNLLPSQGTGALRAVKIPLNAAGFDIRAQINVPMTRDTAHIGERWLSKARKLGRSMGAW